MPEVKFQEPPRRNTGKAPVQWGRAYTEEAEALRARPGDWGIVNTYPREQYNAAKSLYTRIQQGRYRAFRPADDWNATIATEPGEDGTQVVNVYAVYLGSG